MHSPRSIDEDARRRFESAWRVNRPRPIEELLGPPDDPSYLPTLEELVQIELEFRWRASRADSALPGPRIEEYLERFPALRELEVVARLIEEECFIRHRFGDRPEIAEYRRRFGEGGPDDRRFDSIVLRAASGRELEQAHNAAQVGPYRVDDPFAKGGFGLVFAAEDSSLERTVALKQLNAKIAADPDCRRRFLAEARIAAHLEHPGVIPVYALHDPGCGEPFYTMKLVKGETLAEAIQRVHKHAPDQMERIRLLHTFLSVARTMAFAHSRGVIHRDLKPANIVLGAYGETIILDWGLAKHLIDPEPPTQAGQLSPDAQLTQAGSVLGTPVYMSPEQASGDVAAVDQRSDVYALGCLLYELSTGQRAHQGSSSREVIDNVVQAEIIPPRKLVPSIPRALEAICQKAMAPSREHRYADAEGLAQDLELLLADLPVSAYRESPLERLQRWSRRHRRILTTAAACLLLLTIGASFAAVAIDRQRRRAEQAEGQALAEQAATARALERAREQLHVATVNRADAAWRAGKLEEAARLLEECPEEHRLWAWKLVKQRVHGERLAFAGHHGPVADACFSPDGAWVASAGGAGDQAAELLIFSANDGRLRQVVTGHTGWISALDFSPDGKWLLAAGGPRVPLSFNRFGPGASGEALLIDPEQGRIVRLLPDPGGYVHAVRFSPDGSTFALATSTELRIFDAVSLEQRHASRFTPDNWRIPSIEYDPQGDHILLMDGGPQARLLQVESGQWQARPDHALRPGGGIGFSQGGDLYPVIDSSSFARTGQNRDLRLNSLSGFPERSLTGHQVSITAAAFSPADHFVASASVDGSVRIFGLRDGQVFDVIHAHGEGPTALRYDHSGDRLVTAGADGLVKLWDCRAPQGRRRLLPFPKSGAIGLAFSPGGDRLVDSELRVFDCDTGELVLDLNSFEDQPAYFQSLAWSGDGSTIAAVRQVVNADETVVVSLFDAASGAKLFHLDTGLAGAVAAHFLPDGRLAVAGRSGIIRLFEIGGRRRQLDLPRVDRLIQFTPTPTGDALITVADDRAVRVIDLERGEIVRTVERAHLAGIGAVAVAPDGRSFATGSADGAVKLWDTATGELKYTYTGHEQHVIGLGFTPDGRRLISASVDHTARVLDPRSGREILAFPVGDDPEAGLACMALSPDGRLLAIGSRSVQLHLTAQAD